MDAALASELEGALVNHGHTVWADWKSIPPTAAWLDQIFRAIDSSSAFLFAISPDSVVSDMCRLELDYAAKAGKKLIPVLFRKTPPELIPAEVRDLQWIGAHHAGDLEVLTRQLLEALAQDLDWVAFHTRLLVRAREWQADSQNRSLLLRGADLVSSERRLATATAGSPTPTQLQESFLKASRRAAQTNPIRAGTMFGICGFIAAFILSMESLSDWQRAASVDLARASIIVLAGVIATVPFRLPWPSVAFLGWASLPFFEAFVELRRIVWGPSWGEFKHSFTYVWQRGAVGGVFDDDYVAIGWFIGGAVIAFGLSLVLALLAARKSDLLKLTSISLAWVAGLPAAAAALWVLPWLAGSITSDSMRLYSAMSFGIGFAVTGMLLGLLPMRPAHLGK